MQTGADYKAKNIYGNSPLDLATKETQAYILDVHKKN